MDLLTLVFLVFAVALLLWFLRRIEMDPTLRNVIYIVCAVVIFVWLFQALGVLHLHGPVLR